MEIIVSLFLIIAISLSAICAVIGTRNNYEKRIHFPIQSTEIVNNGKCVLTIDGKDFSAVLEEHVFKNFGFDENTNEICEETIKRKYYLENQLPYLKELTFDVIQDHDSVHKCYMSDDRMRLIEC